MIEFGAKTIKYVKYFLKNHFSQHKGSWPEWWAGVMYCSGSPGLEFFFLEDKQNTKV